MRAAPSLLFGSFLAAVSLAVAHPAQAHRPLVSEDVGTVPVGQIEVEAGHDYTEQGDGDRFVTGTYTVNLGVASRAELDVSASAVYHTEQGAERGSGFGDAELLAKYRLVDGRSSWPSVAVAGVVRFPTGDADRGLGRSEADYRVLVIGTQEWAELTLHSNVGWEFLGTADDQLLLSAALVYHVTPQWQAALEWDVATDGKSKTQDERSGVLVGVLWSQAERVTWDAALRFGTVSEDADYTLTTGLTLAF